MSHPFLNIVESISTFDTIKVWLFAGLWGLWMLFKRLAFKLWNPKSFECVNKHDHPPPCLVTASYGHHSFVKLKGVKLHYVEAGSRADPVLLFLHGFPDFWIGWRAQIGEFAKSHRVIALDLKGFGDSDKPLRRKSYRVEVILRELSDLISSFGMGRCSVVGHDLGALLGWYLAHSSPHLIAKFVAISCPHPNLYWSSLPSSSTFNPRWIYFSQIPLLPELEALQEDVRIIDKCHQHLISGGGKIDSFMDAYKYTFSTVEDWTGPINYFRNLPFCQVSNKSGMIEVPCLLIVGNKDNCIELESIIKSTEYTEKYFLKVIENSGHFPHQEHPETVNQALAKFLLGDVAVTPGKSPSGLVNRLYGTVMSAKTYSNQVFGKALSFGQAPTSLISALKS
nr:PREDICTED: epoxide hydrolase 4-like isoform X1 [Bemisia tabaci]